MTAISNLTTTLPRDLKCQLFAALALRDRKFNAWLKEQAETWLSTEGREHGSEQRSDLEARHGAE